MLAHSRTTCQLSKTEDGMLTSLYLVHILKACEMNQFKIHCVVCWILLISCVSCNNSLEDSTKPENLVTGSFRVGKKQVDEIEIIYVAKHEKIKDFILNVGRHFPKENLRNGADMALVSKRLAKEIWAYKSPISETIFDIQSQKHFRVFGVYESEKRQIVLSNSMGTASKPR